jgi:hypothetical protein
MSTLMSTNLKRAKGAEVHEVTPDTHHIDNSSIILLNKYMTDEIGT